MRNTKCLTIGIPVKNEEKSLARLLESVMNSVGNLLTNINVEVIICLNGTTDNSECIIDRFIRECSNRKVLLSKIHSGAGKIVAQQAIVEFARYRGYTCFIDADIVVDNMCLYYLWRELVSNKQAYVAYAYVQPFDSIVSKTAVELIQDIHYKNRDVIFKRKYFHGRAFMMRDTMLLTCLSAGNLNEEQRLKKYGFLNLNKGPLVDDIALSRVIVHEYGTDGIREVNNAMVYFTPPSTVYDFYEGQKRMVLEMKRLDILFPEHAYVQKKYFARGIRIRKLLQLPLWKIIWYGGYRLFEKIIQTIITIQMSLAYLGLGSVGSLWVELKSTKINIGEKV